MKTLTLISAYSLLYCASFYERKVTKINWHINATCMQSEHQVTVKMPLSRIDLQPSPFISLSKGVAKYVNI